MGENSYSEPERGETICASALTAILLLRMQDDPNAFLDRVAKRLEKEQQPV